MQSLLGFARTHMREGGRVFSFPIADESLFSPVMERRLLWCCYYWLLSISGCVCVCVLSRLICVCIRSHCYAAVSVYTRRERLMDSKSGCKVTSLIYTAPWKGMDVCVCV